MKHDQKHHNTFGTREQLRLGQNDKDHRPLFGLKSKIMSHSALQLCLYFPVDFVKAKSDVWFVKQSPRARFLPRTF